VSASAGPPPSRIRRRGGLGARAAAARCGFAGSSARSGTGTLTAAVARTCSAWPRRSIPRSRAGSTITGPSTAPSCVSWHGVSTSTSSGGPCASSSDSAVSTPERWPGCRRSTSTGHACSHTGSSSRSPEAGLWGPDDGRPSRPVLRAAGGETPPPTQPDPRLYLDLGTGRPDPAVLRAICRVGRGDGCHPWPGRGESRRGTRRCAGSRRALVACRGSGRLPRSARLTRGCGLGDADRGWPPDGEGCRASSAG